MKNNIHKFGRNTGVERKRKILSQSLGRWVEIKWEEAPDFFTTIIGKLVRVSQLDSLVIVLRAYDEFRETWISIIRIREIRIFTCTPKKFRPKALLQAKQEKNLEAAHETCYMIREQERMSQLLVEKNKRRK